jgi:hypothetical protein
MTRRAADAEILVAEKIGTEGRSLAASPFDRARASSEGWGTKGDRGTHAFPETETVPAVFLRKIWSGLRWLCGDAPPSLKDACGAFLGMGLSTEPTLNRTGRILGHTSEGLAREAGFVEPAFTEQASNCPGPAGDLPGNAQSHVPVPFSRTCTFAFAGTVS